MAVIANRRSVMTLFSDASCAQSHRVRMVLAEKGIMVDIVNSEPDDRPEDLIDLNPYRSVPTLVDRELVLYDARVIMEYLDERFPHPPLMPVDPVSRARSRLALFRIEVDWYGLLPDLESRNEKAVVRARKILRDSLAASADVFGARPYFLSDEFTLVDASVAPILWRLKRYRIDLPPQAKPVVNYANRLFERPSFVASLTDAEHEMCA